MGVLQDIIADGLSRLHEQVRAGEFGEGDAFDSDAFMTELTYEVMERLE